MGRPPIIKDTEILKDILEAISSGMSNKDACILAGISEESFYHIMRTIEKAKTDPDSVPHSEDYLQFSESLKRARLKFKEKRVANIAKSEQWQSDAWLLERQFPDEYGKKEKVELSGSVESTDLSGMSFEELMALKHGPDWNKNGPE